MVSSTTLQMKIKCKFLLWKCQVRVSTCYIWSMFSLEQLMYLHVCQNLYKLRVIFCKANAKDLVLRSRKNGQIVKPHKQHSSPQPLEPKPDVKVIFQSMTWSRGPVRNFNWWVQNFIQRWILLNFIVLLVSKCEFLLNFLRNWWVREPFSQNWWVQPSNPGRQGWMEVQC